MSSSSSIALDMPLLKLLTNLVTQERLLIDSISYTVVREKKRARLLVEIWVNLPAEQKEDPKPARP
ncbi:hypothetical protein ES705_27039 [subsurface metagenome]